MNRRERKTSKQPFSFSGAGLGGRAFAGVRSVRAAACLVAAAALLSAPAAATASAAPPATTPVGSWNATVVRAGASYDVQMSFGPDQSVCLVSPAGASKGTWVYDGQNFFSYQVREFWYDAGGAVSGWVDIAQGAERTGSAFAGSGQSTVHRADGTVEFVVPVAVNGVRTGPPNGSACV